MSIHTYQNDTWTLADDYGMAATADSLARIVLQAPPPFAARVVGKWGAGKTSILRRAFATLGGQPVSKALPLGENREAPDIETYKDLKFEKRELNWPEQLINTAKQSLCVWYSPWQHQGSDNPIIPLLMEIKEHYSTWMKVGKTMGKLNRRGGLAAMTLLEKVAEVALTLGFQKKVKLSGTTEAVRQAWHKAEPNLEDLGDGQRFHLLFEDAVAEVLETVRIKNKVKNNGPARLIVFIDDLDRCEEGQTVNLLESIKLYLNTQNCIFVLALDDAALLNILERHWPGRGQSANREYLEKLFQVTLAVPPPRTDKVKATLAKRLEQQGIPESTACAGEIVSLMEPNPRKIKNFTNTIIAVWEGLEPKPKLKSEVMKLIIYQYLRQYHEPVWRLIEREPKLFQLLRQVVLDQTKKPLPNSNELENKSMMLIREMLGRRFTHILPNTRPEGEAMYRNMTMDKAVDHVLSNLDQKRSDRHFQVMMEEHILDGELPVPYLVCGFREAK